MEGGRETGREGGRGKKHEGQKEQHNMCLRLDYEG